MITDSYEMLGSRVRNLVESGPFGVVKSGSGTRLIEESVELALECGASTGEIYDAVGDCLFKEANKASLYPSSINKNITNNDMVLEEIADVIINCLYIGNVFDISYDKIQQQVFKKMNLLEECNRANKLQFNPSGKFYRIK